MAVEDVITFSDYNYELPVTVRLDPNDPTGDISVSISRYIRGVISGEIRELTINENSQTAFDAFAIAVRGKLKDYQITHPDITYIPNSTDVQVYNTNYNNNEDLIEKAYKNAGTTVIAYPGHTVRVCQDVLGERECSNVESTSPEYSNRTGAFTTYPEESNQYGYYSPHLRKSPNDQSDVATTDPNGINGHGVGLVQYGIINLSNQEMSAKNILLHYYHSSPPYLKVVEAYSGSHFEYQATPTATATYVYIQGYPQDSHDGSIRIVGGTKVYQKAWQSNEGFPRTLQAEVEIKVEVMSSFGCKFCNGVAGSSSQAAA
jgi:hypothetical protein